MGTILTHVAISDGKIKRSSLEVLSHCRTMANDTGSELCAVVADPSPGDHIDEINKYGPDSILTAADDIFEHHHSEPLLEVLEEAVNQTHPSLIAFASTESTKDILGALAARVDGAVLPDVSEFELFEGGVRGKRPVMANKIVSNVQATGDLNIVSVRSGSYDLNERPGDAEVTELNLTFDEGSLQAQLREVLGSSGDKIDLSEAETIVAAGRGVNDEEGTELISELADTLGAAIGASRALTEAGIYDPSLQIGQTGKVVSPQLYIAVGISGAVQHVAGMDKSKVIVAINKDPDAPIFDIADYGIVGDAYEVIPAFIEEIKKIKG